MVQPEAIALFGCNDYGIVMAVQALSEAATAFRMTLACRRQSGFTQSDCLHIVCLVSRRPFITNNSSPIRATRYSNPHRRRERRHTKD